MLRTRPGSVAWRFLKPSELLKEYIKGSDWNYFKFSKPDLFEKLDKNFISKEEVVKIIEKAFDGEFKSLMNKCITKVKESKCNH